MRRFWVFYGLIFLGLVYFPVPAQGQPVSPASGWEDFASAQSRDWHHGYTIPGRPEKPPTPCPSGKPRAPSGGTSFTPGAGISRPSFSPAVSRPASRGTDANPGTMPSRTAAVPAPRRAEATASPPASPPAGKKNTEIPHFNTAKIASRLSGELWCELTRTKDARPSALLLAASDIIRPQHPVFPGTESMLLLAAFKVTRYYVTDSAANRTLTSAESPSITSFASPAPPEARTEYPAARGRPTALFSLEDRSLAWHSAAATDESEGEQVFSDKRHILTGMAGYCDGDFTIGIGPELTIDSTDWAAPSLSDDHCLMELGIGMRLMLGF